MKRRPCLGGGVGCDLCWFRVCGYDRNLRFLLDDGNFLSVVSLWLVLKISLSKNNTLFLNGFD